MPKHSSGNFQNSNNNLSSLEQIHQPPQHFPQQLEQLLGGTTTTAAHLSYENLSLSVPSGGAHSTNNPMYFQQNENSNLHQQHPNAQLTAQQINPVAHHHHQQLTTYASIHQKSNQALNHIQQSEPNHYGSFGNINTAAPTRVVSGGGVISSGVSSSSTTSLDETQNGVSSQHQQQTGSRNNINNSNNNLNNEPCSADQIPALPEGWDMGRDYDGKIYFIDHRSQTTTWVDPRESLGKMTEQKSQGSEHPAVGWDQVCDYQGGIYYVDHANNKTSQEADPRVEWKSLQEEMLRTYLATAESDLKAKQELVDIKQQRLHLAQHDLNHLNTTLTTLSTSTTSLNSTSSNTSSTKYDPDLLKADVIHAKSRVQRLRRELASIDAEVSYKQRGVETLAQVNARFGPEDGVQPNTAQVVGNAFSQYSNMTVEEANAIRSELQSIQQSLAIGEHEKVGLMKNLACLKDDLTRLQHSDSSLDVSSASAAAFAAGNNVEGQGGGMAAGGPLDRFSTASQTDLSGEMIPIGARLAEMARIRLRYDEARRHVQSIQQGLGALEERISPGTLESDKDRLLLIQEKEQLLRELRSITPKSRSDTEMAKIRSEINKLERDLGNAMEDSNRCIADRLRLHEEKQLLLQQLRDWLRTMSQLESQLRLLSSTSSAPTGAGGMMSAAMSSSASSLGSLSSSHASSKGSLSSLSFTDIYGLSTTTPADPAMLDLHRRVEKILSQGGMSPAKQLSSSTPQIQTPHRQSITELTSIEEVVSPTPSIVEQLQSSFNQTTNPLSQSDEHFLQSTTPSAAGHQPLLSPHQPQHQQQRQQLQMPSSQLSLSPRSSLSSVSPPVSPHVDYLLQCASGALPKHSPNPSSAAVVPQRQNVSSYSRSSVENGLKANIKPGLVLECSSSNMNPSTSSSSSLPSPSSPSMSRKNCPGFNNSSTQLGSSVNNGSSNNVGVCEGLSPICERRILESSSSAVSNTPSSSNASNVRSSVVSVAASDESVAGDSGVFEAASPAKQPNSHKHRLASITHPAVMDDTNNSQIVDGNLGIRETAQVLIRLKYSVADSLLYVGVEKARNLQALLVNAYPASESSRKICIKGSLLPPVATTGWIFQTSAIGNEDNERNGSSLLNKVSFGQSFALAVPKTSVDSKTLLLTIWSVLVRKDREDDEECLGSTQLSLADKDLFGTSPQPIIPCWYNVLNFHFVMGGVNNQSKQPSANLNSQSCNTKLQSSATNTPGDKKHLFQPQQQQSSVKPESQMSSRQGTLKEGESSDESTIISSQTSTLTRTIDPEIILTSNINLKPSNSNHSMISQLAQSEMRSSCLYNHFSSSLNQNNLNYSSSPSPIPQSGNKGLSQLPNLYANTGASKSKSSDIQPSTTSSSSISSGPQQGSRQSTPFNTTTERQTGDEDQASKYGNTQEYKLRSSVMSSTGGMMMNNSQKEMQVKGQQQPTLQVEDLTTSFVHPSLVDAETNTECVFLSPSGAPSRGKSHYAAATTTTTGLTVPSNDSVSSLVRRSQTFSPSAPINKNDYVCKLNRSDSDGAMPLYKRLPIQRRMLERRSLRLPSHPMKSMVPSHLPPNKLSIAEGKELRLHTTTQNRNVIKPSSKSSNPSKLQTPLDLELDLAAQQSKLKILQDEIDRLKVIKTKMEDAKSTGKKEIPDWLQEDEPFQELLTKFHSESYGTVGKSHEERRVEKMIRKTGRDIYKLRKTRVARGEMDVHSFKEKMAFFTTMRAKIPLIPPDLESQDGQFGHPLDEINDEDDEEDNESGSDCEITDDVIRRRLQMLESFIEKDENGIKGSGLCEGLGIVAGSGNLNPGDISKNSTLKHSDFAELPLSSPPLPQELPPPLADNSSSSSRSSTTPTKGVSPPVTVTVNGQVQDFSVSPPDFSPPPPPPDYSDETASASVDYHYRIDRTTTKKRNTTNVKKCDLYFGDVDDGDKVGNDDSVNSSACSTPTPTSSSVVDNIDGATRMEGALQKPKERYDYEIDPDIGVIV